MSEFQRIALYFIGCGLYNPPGLVSFGARPDHCRPCLGVARLVWLPA